MENEIDVIISKMNKIEILINVMVLVNFILFVYDVVIKGMGISIDRNYICFIWYIGIDKKIY